MTNSTKTIGVDDVPSSIIDSLMSRARAEVIDGTEQSIRLTEPYPFTWAQLKMLSRLITLDVDRPVLVLPKMEKLATHKGIHQGAYAGKYCTFEAQVVLDRSEGGKRTIFDLVTAQDQHDKEPDPPHDKVHKQWNLLFPGEMIVKGYKKPDLNFRFGRKHYAIKSDNLYIQAFSEDDLELGQVYLFGGLVFSAEDKKNTRAVAFHDNYMLIDWAIPMRNLLNIDQTFFSKFRGLTHDQVRNSVAFPYENSVSDYKELPFLAVFNIKSSTIPLNIAFIGPPGCTKSGFLKRLSAISGDPYMDTGNTTLKGLLPSFSPKSMSPGAMATARSFVLCNEFFDLVKRDKNNDDGYDILSTMKTILEGEVATCRSGHGIMDIVMRGSAILGSNWLSMGKGHYLTSVSDMYSRMDKALLDRILIYPVPTKNQMQMKNSNERRVKELFNRHSLKTGEKDNIKIIEKLETPYPLGTYDLRTLMTFKETLVASMAQESIDELIIQGKDIQDRHGVEIYTRTQDFIANIASAYAFEDALTHGKVDKDTKEIHILPQHVRSAAAFYKVVIRRHNRENENIQLQRKEFYIHAATKGQKFILDTLKTRFIEARGDADREKMPLDQVVMEFERVCPEFSWEVSIRTLLDDKYVLWDGENLMWLPEELDEAAVTALFLGGGALLPQSDALLRFHLIKGNGIGGQLYHNWLNEHLPIRLTEEVQKLVLEAISAYNPQPVTATEIRTKQPSLAHDQIENGLSYMHLAGKLVRYAGNRYGMKP